MSEEPLTPEERYEQELPNIDTYAVSICIAALRDMIDSDRMEMGLLLTALTTLDNRVSVLEAHDGTPDLGPLKPFLRERDFA
jgi:hypothetical protein